jgi:hypothetical protein
MATCADFRATGIPSPCPLPQKGGETTLVPWGEGGAQRRVRASKQGDQSYELVHLGPVFFVTLFSQAKLGEIPRDALTWAHPNSAETAD